MSENLVKYGADNITKITQVLMHGNLANLTEQEKLVYYRSVCETLGLNELTKPFEFITLNGKLQLYATKNCSEQLRMIHNVSITIEARSETKDVWVVIAKAKMANGREDESLGAVDIKGKSGENLANALMKAETKAKRRVTLSICGLGMLDETEAEQFQPYQKANDPDFEFASLAKIKELQALLSKANHLNDTERAYYAKRIDLTIQNKKVDGRDRAFDKYSIEQALQDVRADFDFATPEQIKQLDLLIEKSKHLSDGRKTYYANRTELTLQRKREHNQYTAYDKYSIEKDLQQLREELQNMVVEPMNYGAILDELQSIQAHPNFDKLNNAQQAKVQQLIDDISTGEYKKEKEYTTVIEKAIQLLETEQ